MKSYAKRGLQFLHPAKQLKPAHQVSFFPFFLSIIFAGVKSHNFSVQPLRRDCVWREKFSRNV